MTINRFIGTNNNDASFELLPADTKKTDSPSDSSVYEIAIQLTAAEIRNAFEEYRLSCLYADAENHFVEYLSDEDGETSFCEKHGFTAEQALNSASENYILEDVVEYFSNHADCNLAENNLWQAAFSYVLG